MVCWCDGGGVLVIVTAVLHRFKSDVLWCCLTVGLCWSWMCVLWKKGTGKQGTPHEKASQRWNLFCYKQWRYGVQLNVFVTRGVNYNGGSTIVPCLKCWKWFAYVIYCSVYFASSRLRWPAMEIAEMASTEGRGGGGGGSWGMERSKSRS